MSSGHARPCWTSSTARARTLRTPQHTPRTPTTWKTSVCSCTLRSPSQKPITQFTVFRLVWLRDREGVNAELEAERAQHGAEISRRASQHIVQATALEHRARGEDRAVCAFPSYP